MSRPPAEEAPVTVTPPVPVIPVALTVVSFVKWASVASLQMVTVPAPAALRVVVDRMPLVASARATLVAAPAVRVTVS